MAYSTSSTSAGSVPNAFWAGFVGLDILQAERELVGIEAFGAAAEPRPLPWLNCLAQLVRQAGFEPALCSF
jgi:hypothetical protein